MQAGNAQGKKDRLLGHLIEMCKDFVPCTRASPLRNNASGHKETELESPPLTNRGDLTRGFIHERIDPSHVGQQTVSKCRKVCVSDAARQAGLQELKAEAERRRPYSRTMEE